jgi:pimeloyl-ACP methyl ester carboxylesterase
MKRREWILAAIGLVLLAFGWRAGESHRLPATEITLEGSCRVPVRVIGDRPESGQPSVVVLHGLGANQMVMETIGQVLASANMKVYVPDLPGHGNNSSPFTVQRAEACAVEAIGALERRGQIQLDKTVFLGHSMGGALAIRMADYFPAAATVAISPAPLSVVPGMPPGAILMAPPRRMPVNLLVFVGQFDFPFMQRSADALVSAAGGERFKEPEDFQQRRAVRLLTIAGDTHTSLIYDVRVWDSILNQWLAPSLSMPVHGNLSRSLFWGPTLGIIGLAFFFPLIASAVAAAQHTSSSESDSAGPFRRTAFVSWLVAGLFAVSVLNFSMPLRFVKMYGGDYLASCLLIAGIVLCALMWRAQPKGAVPGPQFHWQSVWAGAAMGLFAMLAFGAWVNWALTDMWLNSARWMRFPVILLSCLPYAFAEERVLGIPGIGNWLEKLRRYLFFFALRLMIWLSILFAVYVYSSQQILLAVLVFFMGIFSLFVRLGADAIRRRTATPVGAAVFTAILMAWFIAAVFPLT